MRTYSLIRPSTRAFSLKVSPKIVQQLASTSTFKKEIERQYPLSTTNSAPVSITITRDQAEMLLSLIKSIQAANTKFDQAATARGKPATKPIPLPHGYSRLDGFNWMASEKKKAPKSTLPLKKSLCLSVVPLAKAAGKGSDVQVAAEKLNGKLPDTSKLLSFNRMVEAFPAVSYITNAKASTKPALAVEGPKLDSVATLSSVPTSTGKKSLNLKDAGAKTTAPAGSKASTKPVTSTAATTSAAKAISAKVSAPKATITKATPVAAVKKSSTKKAAVIPTVASSQKTTATVSSCQESASAKGVSTKTPTQAAPVKLTTPLTSVQADPVSTVKPTVKPTTKAKCAQASKPATVVKPTVVKSCTDTLKGAPVKSAPTSFVATPESSTKSLAKPSTKKAKKARGVKKSRKRWQAGFFEVNAQSVVKPERNYKQPQNFQGRISII